MQITKKLREMLKKPLGKVVSFEEAAGICKGKRVVAVGDEVVFNFLERGVIPFLSVFDLKTLRVPVDDRIKGKIKEFYPKAREVEKPAGELNEEMFEVAKEMLKKGGGLYVDGEEDLFALPFAFLMEKEIVVYGQPGKGCVILDKETFDKERFAEIIRGMGINVSP